MIIFLNWRWSIVFREILILKLTYADIAPNSGYALQHFFSLIFPTEKYSSTKLKKFSVFDENLTKVTQFSASIIPTKNEFRVNQICKICAIYPCKFGMGIFAFEN